MTSPSMRTFTLRSSSVRMSTGMPSTWFGRCIAASVGTVIGLVMLVVLVPIVVAGVVLAVVGGAGALLRRWIGKQREPNGVLDGRRNVRVVRNEDPG